MALSYVAKVGTVQFHGWTGYLPASMAEVDAFTRLGQNGSGAQNLGTRSQPTNCTAWIACVSRADALQQAAAVEALPGTVVTVVDPWGRTFVRVRVSEAAARPKAAKGPVVTGTSPATFRVDCSMTLEVLP